MSKLNSKRRRKVFFQVKSLFMFLDEEAVDTKNILSSSRRTRGKVIDYSAFGSDEEETDEDFDE